MRRHHVVSTSLRRHFNVVCLLGYRFIFHLSLLCCRLNSVYTNSTDDGIRSIFQGSFERLASFLPKISLAAVSVTEKYSCKNTVLWIVPNIVTAHRLTGRFLLLQNFNVGISGSPHVCCTLVLILISMCFRYYA